MQRFKKFAMQHGNVDAHGQPVVFGKPYGFKLGSVHAQQTGKFSYGSGRMSLAATARRQVYLNMDTARTFIAADHGTATDIEAVDMLERCRFHNGTARRAGFRLPR
jgi:hypothetical protein